MKYIMIKMTIKDASRYVPIIFPECLVHKNVAESMEHLMGFEHSADAITISAGFYSSIGKCHGESESLGLQSDPERDTNIIRDYPLYHGLIV